MNNYHISIHFFCAFSSNIVCLFQYNSQNDDVSEKTRNFTDIEQNLFNSGFQPSVAFSEWKSGKQKKIRVSAAADSS